jgi:hypothetical protein
MENERLIFPDYLDGELYRDIVSFVSGKGKLHKVLGRFFDRLRFCYTRKNSKYSPMQVLNDEGLLELLWQRVESKPRVYERGRWDVTSFMAAIHIGQHSKLCNCGLIANFPAKEARNLFRKYCPAGGLVYDPSAGFGSRMGAALLSGYQYVATDPNKDLYPLLQKFYGFLLDSDFVSREQEFNVFCQGSEVSIPQLYGKADFVFTSPPYFNFERYSDDRFASTRNYGNFRLWVKEYVVPTIINIKNYLRPGACAAINIKNVSGLKLYEVWRNVFIGVKGFKELEPFAISVRRRQYGKGKGDNWEEELKNYYGYLDQELCMVFQKE